MGLQYPYSAVWVKNIVVVIHIYWSRSSLLLFYDNQYLNISHIKWKWVYLNLYSPRENRKVSMRQWHPYSTRWEKNIVAVHRIYAARAILILFYYHKDNESESCELDMSISQTIFTHKNISKALWDNNIHNLQYGWRIYCGNSYYVFTKRLNLSNVKYILAHLNQYSPII